MAHYLHTIYYLFDNSRKIISVGSKITDFESFIENCDENSYFINASSRYSWSAIVLSEFLESCDNKDALPFLTEIRTPDSPYGFMLISSDSYAKIVIDINNLILWCRMHIDRMCQITQCGYSPDQTLKYIDNIEDSYPSLDVDNINSLFAYLRRILTMIRHAEETQQSILCFSYRS